EGELPVLDLPLDHARPETESNAQARVSFRIESHLAGRLRHLARAHQCTLFALLLAAYHTLLHRHSGQNDIIVGVPASGRGRWDLADQVGYFVNPVAIRTRLQPEEPFATLLTRVRDTLIGGLA